MKKSFTGKKFTPGGMTTSPNKAPTASDVYEAASAYFPGAQQFFFQHSDADADALRSELRILVDNARCVPQRTHMTAPDLL